MKYVTCMGTLYKLTERNYIKFLKGIIDNDTYDKRCIDKLGKFLGYVKNITDLNKEDARNLLEETKKKGEDHI